MKLYKMKVLKGGKRYIDYIIAWTYNNRLYLVRVVPCFSNAYKSWMSHAILIDDVRKIRKDDVGA